MGKVTGFLEYPRVTAGYRPAGERMRDYKDVTLRMQDESLQLQGARCMDCGVPYCHSMGCPVYNLIPEWNDLVYRNQWRDALERLEYTNNLPEITGRICPAPCETACTLSINTHPVTIKQVELGIIEYGFAHGWVLPRPPYHETGKKVAVIGSGPAGLAASQQLRRAGHEVTLFEKSDKIGGLLRYGIPDFKLEKWVIDRRLEQMRAEGVNFETGVVIGEDISARYLQRSFDVALLTVGSGQPRDLRVPGRELDGIHFAMDYLTQSNKCVAGILQPDEIISARDKHVLVIGGGDTGSDCVGTANRQGAKKVTQYEILPKPHDWKEPWNPEWPYWPNILRASSSHEEGCEREWSILTRSFSGDDGKVEAIHCARLEWKQGDNGAPSMNEVAGSEFSLKVDLVLLAMGFVHPEHNRLVSDFGLEFDQRGNIKTDQNYKSSVDGVYAAGDSNIGASLVVRAIYHGRQAAAAIDRYLRR